MAPPKTPEAIVQIANVRLDVTSSKTIDFSERVPATLARLGLANQTQEAFWVIAYDSSMKVRTIVEIARGGYAAVQVSFPALFAAVLASGCDRFSVAHNHPSDSLVATPRDRKLTASIMDAANLLGLFFEDHWIIGPSGKAVSLTEQRMMIPATYGLDAQIARDKVTHTEET